MTSPVSPGAGTGPASTGGSGAPTTEPGNTGAGAPAGAPVEPAAPPAALPAATLPNVQPTATIAGAPAAQPPAPVVPPAAGASGADWKVEDLPEGAQRHIQETRADAANRRAAAQAAETARKASDEALKAVMDGLTKIVNPGQTPETPLTPEQLTAEVTGLRGNNTSLKAQNTRQTVLLKAWERGTVAGAEVTALLDSIQFRDSLKGLDPTAADFQSTLDTKIKEGIALDPRRFTAASVQAAAAAPSGGDFGGGPAGATQEDDSVEGLLKARDAEYKRLRGLA